MNVVLVRSMAFRCALMLLVSACAVAGMRQAHSQTLSLSGSVRAGDLWCLPATDAPDSYYYVPNGAAIDADDAGSPTFSFLRYAYGEAGRATGTDQLIADGGGLVHFLIVLQTPEDRVETARSELRGVTGNPDAELRGPLVFSEGRFTLISSVLNQARNESETKILAAGRAPLLEGNQLAFSFDLSTTDATLFLESLQTATPDASVVFEMSFAAVTPAFDGKLTVDWTELSKHRSFKAGADVYFLSAEVEDVLDEITRSQAVRIESRGSDAKSEAMLAHAHEQLTNLLFRPVSGASMPETEQAGLAEVVAAISKSAERAVIQASGAPAISASVGYRIKELKSEGRSVIELTHSEIVQRRATIVMNVSDLYQRWGTDTAHFRVVNLEDPVFRQREIRVLLDGSLQEDFANYINHVTVTVKKDHAGGSQTVREVQYDRRAFDDGELERQLVYGWHDDADPLDWRNYEYRARWSFFGGGTFDTGWLDAQDSKINLFAPYQRQSLKLLGQWAALEQAGVRSVDVAVRYPFFGNTKTQRLGFQAEESFASQGIEMILPAGTREYDYDIQWTLAGGEIVAQSGRDWRQHLVVDELPPPLTLERSMNTLYRTGMVAAILLLMLPIDGNALVVDSEVVEDLVLSDGTPLRLMAAATSGDAAPSDFYYLPTGGQVRLAQRPDGTPEFLLLKYNSDRGTGPQGGLLHFLVEWGLSGEQLADAQAKLQARRPGASVKGAVPLEPYGDGDSFRLISATIGSEGLSGDVVTTGTAPPLPGSRAAAASNLTAEGAQLLTASLTTAESVADLSVAFDYSYTERVPAARGRVIFDWTRLEENEDDFNSSYERWATGYKFSWARPFGCCKRNHAYSHRQVRSYFEYLEEASVVTLEFDELVDDERVDKIRDAFFDYFLNQFTKPSDTEATQNEQSPAFEEPDVKDLQKGDGYTFVRSFTSEKNRVVRQEFDLKNYRIAVRKRHPVVANFASFYDRARDNPKCIPPPVYLNDPFFQQNSIRLVLDMPNAELFTQHVNYATINVRKRRSDGSVFSDRLTFDERYVRDNGLVGVLTYVPGEDRDPSTFEYQVQWSFKGGIVHPEAPEWRQGGMEALPIRPPLVPKRVELEADTAQMTASELSRVTAQVEYSALGRKRTENLHVSSSHGEPVVASMLFMDPNHARYRYRLILNHKRLGKIELPWTTRSSDDGYIFAAIPSELAQAVISSQSTDPAVLQPIVDDVLQGVFDNVAQ